MEGYLSGHSEPNFSRAVLSPHESDSHEPLCMSDTKSLRGSPEELNQSRYLTRGTTTSKTSASYRSQDISPLSLLRS